jgi:ribulose-5-phosphate 4-epimerase/fuculose-1-phosphate aldolase
MSEHKNTVALANRILFQNGVLDAFGHVSMRNPLNPNEFLLARNMAPAQVTASDILIFNLDGLLVSDSSEKSYLERYIHAAIYSARPEINSVVHSHSPAVVPFTIVPSVRLRPVCHMSGFLRGLVPNFEIRQHAGPGSDLLIRDLYLGNRLAETLGKGAAVLMRGHGFTTCGESVQEAVYRAIYTQNNAQLQAAAMAMGEIVYLTDEEAVAADMANMGQISRAWNFWTIQADF